MAEDKPPMISATLLLERPAVIDYEKLVATVGKALGISREAVAHMSPEGAMLFPAEGGLVTGLNMDVPSPADLSNIAHFAHWWPTANADIARNKAHFMVMASWSKYSRLDAHMRHMVLIRELVEQLPVIAVLWGSVLTPAENFKGEFQLAMSGQIPILLWVLIQYTKQPNGNTLISTLGMRDFGHMEIEAESALPMQQTYDLVRQFGTYVIGHNRRVADGDTIGLTEDQKVKVRHTRSFRPDVNDKVYWFELAKETTVKKPRGLFSWMFGSNSKH